jgi:hypothetical protein
MTSPDLLIYRARLAEQVELYSEMKDSMKEMVKLGKPLEEEERNLLSVAYKNVVGQRRTSWRIICSLESKTEDPNKISMCQQFRQKIETELHELCDEIIDLLNKYLLKEDEDKPETAVFFYKMQGDYLRYKVEISTGADREALSKEAEEAYGKAQKVAEGLTATHPIRLGLALNFSVFFYEIANNPEQACKLAKSAFDEAMEVLDQTNEDTYKDSTLIMQLLRDNLSLWRTPEDDDEPQ